MVDRDDEEKEQEGNAHVLEACNVLVSSQSFQKFLTLPKPPHTCGGATGICIFADI